LQREHDAGEARQEEGDGDGVHPQAPHLDDEQRTPGPDVGDRPRRLRQEAAEAAEDGEEAEDPRSEDEEWSRPVQTPALDRVPHSTSSRDGHAPGSRWIPVKNSPNSP